MKERGWRRAEEERALCVCVLVCMCMCVCVYVSERVRRFVCGGRRQVLCWPGGGRGVVGA